MGLLLIEMEWLWMDFKQSIAGCVEDALNRAFGQAPMDGEAAKSAAAPLVLQALQRLTR